MFKKILKGLYMILFIVFIPPFIGLLVAGNFEPSGLSIGVFTFLYLIFISIQYLKFGFFNPLKLFETNKDEL